MALALFSRVSCCEKMAYHLGATAPALLLVELRVNALGNAVSTKMG